MADASKDPGDEQKVLIHFSAPVTAADFTPSWFFDEDQGTSGNAVVQANATTLEVTFNDDTFLGDTIDLTNQPSYVIPGQSVIIA